MNAIKIKDLEDLKKLIKDIDIDGSYNIEIEDSCRFYAVSDEDYDLLCSVKEMIETDFKNDNQTVKIVSNDISQELSFEQYEVLKKQINEALDKTLKPKAEKLN